MKRFLALLALAACSAPAPTHSGPPPVGSDRGSVVAVGPDVPGSLVYLTSEDDEAELAALRAAAPGVRVIGGLSREAALDHAAGARGADAHLVTAELLARAPDLAWVQAWSAGVERYLAIPELAGREGLVLTNMKGVHGPVIAEHVFGMLLTLTRGLREYGAAQREGRWVRGDVETTELAGRTLLVVGLGGIGREVARRGDAFGMEVLATDVVTDDPPAFVDHLGPADELDALLPRADVVAICVPLTPETEGMFGAERLDRTRPGAIVVNIARGRIVDTDALVAALESGHLGGACLDVTDPEPLPEGHPLWSRPDVVITPHVASRAALTEERRTTLFHENLRRFGAREPLLNVVDRAAGY